MAKSFTVVNETIKGNGKFSLSSYLLSEDYSTLIAVISASPLNSKPNGNFIKARVLYGDVHSPWVSVYSSGDSYDPQEHKPESTIAKSSTDSTLDSTGSLLTIYIDTLSFPAPLKVASSTDKLGPVIAQGDDVDLLQAVNMPLVLEVDSSFGTEEEIHLALWLCSPSEVKSWPQPLPVSENDLTIDVPFRSQMIETEVPPRDVCLPTSLAMVCEYYGATYTTAEVAKACYDHSHSIYGNWLKACLVAGSYGLKAKVLAIESLEGLLPWLKKGVPPIVSVSYDDGELSGAPVNKTRGHLLVVRGVGVDGRILVCDPAGNTKKDGYISYDPVQFAKAMKGVAICLTK